MNTLELNINDFSYEMTLPGNYLAQLSYDDELGKDSDPDYTLHEFKYLDMVDVLIEEVNPNIIKLIGKDRDTQPFVNWRQAVSYYEQPIIHELLNRIYFK